MVSEKPRPERWTKNILGRLAAPFQICKLHGIFCFHPATTTASGNTFPLPGSLVVRGQIDLWQMLQPAIQPGGKLDYERPSENVTVQFHSSVPFNLRIGDSTLSSASGGDGHLQASFQHNSEEQWVPFELSLATGEAVGPLKLTCSWSTSEDSRLRSFPLRRFYLPWAKLKQDSPAPESNPVPELAGGDWLRGKQIFFGDGC